MLFSSVAFLGCIDQWTVGFWRGSALGAGVLAGPSPSGVSCVNGLSCPVLDSCFIQPLGCLERILQQVTIVNLLYNTYATLVPRTKQKQTILSDSLHCINQLSYTQFVDVSVTKYNTIQYNTIQYNTIQYNTIQYNTIQYNTIQYNTIQYNTIQYNTIQYNTIVYHSIFWMYDYITLRVVTFGESKSIHC